MAYEETDNALFEEDDFEDDFGIVFRPQQKFRVVMIGFDESGRKTDFDFAFGSYSTETAAIEAIEEFYNDFTEDIRAEYLIPDEVKSIELRGFKAADEDNIYSEDELFTVWPFNLN